MSVSVRNIAATVSLLLLVLVGSTCSSGFVATTGQSAAQVMPPQSAWPRSRAELSNYTVTSSHADVEAFIDSLQKLGARIAVGSIGKTAQGRNLPYVIASRPLVSTPEAARQLGRPIVYVQGNIHSGEVEGKEALQALLRDLVFSPSPNVLDSVVLIAVPNYNADGNENQAPQARNRGSQNGPEMVGTRPTSEGHNLNRDYVKAYSPETRGSLEMFNKWDPHVFVDLHTSNGSMHGYAITYSPPLNPAAVFTYPYTRDSLLPVIRERMRSRRNFETFDYGNWGGNCGDNCSWGTYDHTPRYGTNYYGLRNRIAILSEAFSHDPFEKRVKATYAFVGEILSLSAEKSREIQALTKRADSITVGWGRNPASAPEIAVRSTLTNNPFRAPVLVAEVITTPGDTTRYEAGLRPGSRKSGVVVPREMNIRDRFDPVLTRPMPAGYALSGAMADSVRDKALAMLRFHGVAMSQLAAPLTQQVQIFKIDGIRSGRYENFLTTDLTGEWRAEQRTIPAGTWVVPSAQPLALLAMYLLEPQSDDGIATYTTFDPALTSGGDFPVVRLTQPPPASR